MADIFDRDPKRPRRFGTEPESCPTPVEDEHTHRLRRLEDDLLELTGKSGTNGKIGNLRKDVDFTRSILKYIATGVVGSVITAITAIYQAGQEDGSKEREAEYLRAEVASLKAEVRELRAQMPAYRPVWPRGVDQ